MGWYKKWAAKQRGKTSLLFIGGVSGMLCVWLGYRNYFAPWLNRKRLREAEEYANILLKSEK